jgi:hypothetical protein
MFANEYKVLSDCIERGLRLGFNRANKHEECTNEEQLFIHQENAIMNEICEYFTFKQDGEKED